MREQWESNAEAFSDLIDGEGTPHHRKILNPCVEVLLGDVVGKKLLDAGSGEGYLARYYAKKGADVIAIDLSQRLIETSLDMGLVFPCSFTVFEQDGKIKVGHVSIMKIGAEIGLADKEAMAPLIEDTGKAVQKVWNKI